MASQVQLHWEQGMGMQRGRTTGRPWSCSMAMFRKHYREESHRLVPFPLGFHSKSGVESSLCVIQAMTTYTWVPVEDGGGPWAEMGPRMTRLLTLSLACLQLSS